jgi:2-methylisocitrate lyase-like PEP mutase family enzyme
MQRYIDTGADMAFIEAPQSIEQMRRIASAIKART